jgi:metal-responsive CopG/Arc/MetJ family transcriptional regulator
MVKSYMNIKLPKQLIIEIDKLITEGTLGYRSRGEFVAEATRLHLLKITELLKTKQNNVNQRK